MKRTAKYVAFDGGDITCYVDNPMDPPCSIISG